MPEFDRVIPVNGGLRQEISYRLGNFWSYIMFTKNIADYRMSLAAVLLAVVALAPLDSHAGGYIGGSVGQAYIEVDSGDPTIPESFDEEDFGFKAFAGYEFDLPINLGLEAAYVDFGAPSGDVGGTQLEVDANGFAAFGTLGFDLGPIGVFGKYGVISWDADLTIDGFDAGSDDGSDPAYGVGVKFGLGSVDIRGEYEIFDIESSDDVALLSIGIVWSF